MRLIFIALLTATFHFSFSQSNRAHGVSYERNDDKSVTFTYNGETSGTTYVVLKFKQLTNSTAPNEIRTNVNGFSGILTTLYPTNSKEHISFSYSYRPIMGDINAKPNHNFKYVLPFKNGKEVMVRHLSFLGERMGGKKPKNWASFQFLVKPNDTVCAIRKGVVVNIIDGNAASNKAEYGYKNKSNSMLVEHDDGTIASYGVLKKNSFMVEVGDMVYPSTPLAIAGTYDKAENSQLRLSIFYLDKVVKDYNFDNRVKETYATRTNLYAYVNPMFVINSDGSGFQNLEKNQAYTSFYNEGLIQAEMTKREKKKYLKRKK
ncbi:peptidoglycan DD-metalloendopeptidase family protein [Seonamhaeicola marinus]|uniref:M23 family metallopeptidase n=1 Tax=Seonamhaeicola marinus TaxID=1912246 RepID=A0A5D0HUM2_9FLAO|nr:peptidoglycan DD-metalloendopeptidase family protein [Seonamhaeicola marinus]TYA74601.1 M23 family metallopeptidase [Seonamhaeicola marinus]